MHKVPSEVSETLFLRDPSRSCGNAALEPTGNDLSVGKSSSCSRLRRLLYLWQQTNIGCRVSATRSLETKRTDKGTQGWTSGDDNRRSMLTWGDSSFYLGISPFPLSCDSLSGCGLWKLRKLRGRAAQRAF